MQKYLHLPGKIILQFLQDNEEGIRQITKHNFKLVLCIMKEPLQEKHTEMDTETDHSKQDMELYTSI